MRWPAALINAALACGAGAPVLALDLVLPNSAVMTREVHREATAYFLPTGPFAHGVVPAIEIEGAFLQQAWRTEASGLTSLQLLHPLRQQIIAAGYDILLDCAALECGGFDFRFQTEVMPAPDMFVDLLDFRFLSARKGGGEFMTVLVSRVSDAGYIQVIRLSEAALTADDLGVAQGGPAPDVAVPDRPPEARGQLGLDVALLSKGSVILRDLDFGSGSVSLGEGPFATLEALAAFLKKDESRRVALVGHTDTVGQLAANIELSQRRAASVLKRLVERYNIPRTQLEAEGMGYLAPVASNLTPEGREANRRVEAVLLNTE